MSNSTKAENIPLSNSTKAVIDKSKKHLLEYNYEHVIWKQRINNLGEKTHFKMNFTPENERYHFWSMPGKSSYEDTDNEWYQSSMNMKMVIATGIGAVKVNDPHLFSKYGDFEKLSRQRANVVSYDILCFNLYFNSPEVSWYLLVCELGQTNF